MAKRKFPVAEFPIEGLSVPMDTIVEAVRRVKASQDACDCKHFCESCGRYTEEDVRNALKEGA